MLRVDIAGLVQDQAVVGNQRSDRSMHHRPCTIVYSSPGGPGLISISANLWCPTADEARGIGQGGSPKRRLAPISSSLLLPPSHEKRVRRTSPTFKSAGRQKSSANRPPGAWPRVRLSHGSAGQLPGIDLAAKKLVKIFPGLLKPDWLFLIFCLPPDAVRAPFQGPAATGAGRIRRLLVPNLLYGGFGYENHLRFRPALAFDHRI